MLQGFVSRAEFDCQAVGGPRISVSCYLQTYNIKYKIWMLSDGPKLKVNDIIRPDKCKVILS